jgi:hypothetical protein
VDPSPAPAALVAPNIPPPPAAQNPNRLSKWWRDRSRFSKALIIWIVSFAAIGVALFLLVTSEAGVAMAFDVLVGHRSPLGTKTGAGGVLLSVFGYLVVPATIGSIVAAAFTRSTQISPSEARNRFEALTREVVGKALTAEQVTEIAAKAVATMTKGTR